MYCGLYFLACILVLALASSLVPLMPLRYLIHTTYNTLRQSFLTSYSNMKYILVLTLLLYLILMVMMEPNVGNCLRKDEIDVLEEEGKCASSNLQDADGSKQLQWERCLEKLAKKLDQRCDGLGVSKV